ncbi:hypothetical protein D9756_003137 [Leucocoprinus leucothites]|uniref:Methyltransferase ausD n=1 Tax=Leucocoprinus leucothites TaxID=201217 RepID=A0A8H5G6C7_9AGAR|nr:hypothetical protein D9756_003137 [Leucoagaricus leucothites]
MTMSPNKVARDFVVLPFDPSFLELRDEETEFLKSWTGITNEEELRTHIVDVSAKAYETFPYPCIRGFAFTKLKISRLPVYPKLLKLVQDQPSAILLDAACCFGNDLRKAVLDGWPVENAIGFDLEPLFWQYGHELFKSTPQSFPAGFVAGNAFEPHIIEPREQPFYEAPITPRPQNLQELKSLMPLQGHISAIHASSFFHIFSEEKQIQLARRLASLLSPEPGSMIFGCHRGLKVKAVTSDLLGFEMTCYSPETWRDLWDGVIFRKGTVDVRAELRDANREDVSLDDGGKIYFLDWSVTRLRAD